MTTIAKPVTSFFRLPHWQLLRFNNDARHRRRVTLDLINASPHLLRDIGVVEGKVVVRGR